MDTSFDKNNLLTEREKDILCLMAVGMTNGEIAKELFISYHTVKSHIENIFQKLSVHNKVQAAIHAVFNKVISREDLEKRQKSHLE